MNRVEQAGKGNAPRSAAGVMEQIAGRVGCSKSTVSRVLSGKGKNFSVRPELREAILRTADELEYRPNPFLQMMRSRESKIIAVFDPVRDASETIREAKESFIRRIRSSGYVATGSYLLERYRVEEYTVPFPIAGALLFNISDPAFLAFFERKEIPYAVVNGLQLDRGVGVQVDERHSAALIIGALAERGHEHVAYYAVHSDFGDPRQHYSGALRERELREELQRHGIWLLEEVTGMEEASAELFLRRSVLENGATAVVCYDHVRAEEIAYAAWKLGLRIPGDISVVSFSDNPTLRRMTPPVSACSFSGGEMGEVAARTLLECLNGESGVCSRIYKVRATLVERGSIAAAKEKRSLLEN